MPEQMRMTPRVIIQKLIRRWSISSSARRCDRHALLMISWSTTTSQKNVSDNRSVWCSDTTRRRRPWTKPNTHPPHHHYNTDTHHTLHLMLVVTIWWRLQKIQSTRGGAVTVVWQTLCKLCLPWICDICHRQIQVRKADIYKVQQD